VIEARSWDLEALRESVRLYLRWRLRDRPGLDSDWDPDQFNEVVLHYVIVLEKVAMLPDEKQNVTCQLVDRVARLVGRNNSEIRGVANFAKRAYDERGQIVHRRQTKRDRSPIDLQKLRDVCRRAMASAIIIAGRSTKENYLEGFLRELVVSGNAEQHARRIAAEELARGIALQIGSLTRCVSITSP
jgi:hypothetical protein